MTNDEIQEKIRGLIQSEVWIAEMYLDPYIKGYGRAAEAVMEFLIKEGYVAN